MTDNPQLAFGDERGERALDSGRRPLRTSGLDAYDGGVFTSNDNGAAASCTSAVSPQSSWGATTGCRKLSVAWLTFSRHVSF